MTEPFVARREARWEYAGDCIEHIEDNNCWLGCKHGEAVADYFTANSLGPGGSCDVLVRIILEEPVSEIVDDGVTLRCTARTLR